MPGKTSTELVLALDQGSSSSRALAIDARGKVAASAQFPIRTFTPRAGWHEHDPLEIARSQERALDAALARLPRGAEVAAVGLACQRSTVVFWDAETGKPAGRALSWQDGRAAGIVAPLQERQEEAHETTGLLLTPYYSAPKIRWCLDNVPAVRRLADADRLRVGPVSSFLLWRLTGGEVFAVDPSLAQRTMLFDIGSLDWSPGMLSLFGVDRRWLPEIRPSAGSWGALKRGGRCLRLLSCLGDQQAAMAGLGGLEPGASVANYGTGAFFLHNGGARQKRVPGLLTSIGWKVGSQSPCFLQEGTVHAAGTSFDWLRDKLGLLKSGGGLERLLSRSRRRVLALPAIGGLGAPRWDYTTKTAFWGLDSQTTAADLVRGVAEGLCFLVADIVDAMRDAGFSPASARVAGGLSRLDTMMQFQADILGIELERCAQLEATAFGAASLAARAAGLPWAGRLNAPRVERRFKPAFEPARRAALLGAWRRFVDAQAALSREISLP